MEQNQNTSSGLGIDQSTINHLSEAARWAKFLAIIGFIVCVFVALIGIFASTFLSFMSDRFNNSDTGSGQDIFSGLKSFIAIIYIGIAFLYFLPCLYLFRFANFMKAAIATSEQENLDKSFQNLKIMFRFVGILTIVIICFYFLAFLFSVVFSATLGIG